MFGYHGARRRKLSYDVTKELSHRLVRRPSRQ